MTVTEYLHYYYFDWMYTLVAMNFVHQSQLATLFVTFQHR
jgi:hypothetical protein